MRLCDTLKVGDTVMVHSGDEEPVAAVVEALGDHAGEAVIDLGGRKTVPVYVGEVGDMPPDECLKSHGYAGVLAMVK